MKEEFKTFVKANPQLVSYVNHGDMTWQKFYEMHELYGDNHDIWNDYKNKLSPTTNSTPVSSGYTANDFMNVIKSMDSTKVKKGITSAQKFLNALQGFVKDDTAANITPKVSNYIPRPIYRHFED